MFKHKYVLEVKGQEDRLYRFECDASAPLGELNDALYSMKSIVVKQLNEQHEKEKVAKKVPEVCKEECKKEEEKK